MACIKKYVPDFITSLGLASGVLGVVFALEGKIWLAFPLMLAAAVFDFCDGLAARALDAYSDLGKELDSLSDMVSFGVLPSVMLYNLMKTCTFSSSAWCLVPLLLAVFSGLRLAKFNVDPRQHMSFVGLPTPVAALLCGSLPMSPPRCSQPSAAAWYSCPFWPSAFAPCWFANCPCSR